MIFGNKKPKRSPAFPVVAKKDPIIARKREIEELDRRLGEREKQWRSQMAELRRLAREEKQLETDIRRLQEHQKIERDKLDKYVKRRSEMEQTLHELNEGIKDSQK